jgi:hypothetical protein
MGKLWRVLCPIRQYNDKLILQCNSYKKGHTHLVWYNIADSENIKESEILSPVVTVTGLDEGEYAFYTRNEESASVRTYIQILKETAEEAVERIEQYVDNINHYHKDALELLRERLKDDPDSRPISLLIALYRALVEAQNTDRKKAYFQLIAIAQYCDNSRSLHMNKDNEAPVYIKNDSQASIEVGSMVTKIIVHKIVGSKKGYYAAIQTAFNPSHSLQLADNGEYVIEAYTENDLVGVYVHFSGNDATKQWIWESQCATENKTTDAKEQLLELPASFSFFAEEEQQRILIERAKNPFDELIARPQVTITKNSVDVVIENSELLGALGNFYIVAKEPDQLFTNGFDRVEKVAGSTATFKKAKHLLSDVEDYYFYIQDESKRLVSKLELLSLAGADYEEYKENLRQLELYDYNKRLAPLIDYRIPAANEAVKVLMEAAKNDSDVNTSNVYKYLIGQLNTNKHLAYFNAAVNAIMEDRISHGLFTQSFFSKGIKLERAVDKLIFPPKDSKYVLQVDKISINSNEVVTEYYESGLGAIEVQARGADYFIYQAIDKQSYRRSGYVFINTAKYSSCITNWNIDIEVI